MATTLPAMIAVINADPLATYDAIGRRGYAAWDSTPPPDIPLTAAQRASAVTTLLAGTITDPQSVTDLVNSCVSGATTAKHVWRIVLGYQDQTVG